MIHLLWTVIVGFLVGLFARAVVPGADHIGFLATALLGIVGSLVGGVIATVVRPPREGAIFHPAGFFLSVIGAIGVLLVWHRLH
jgi:uncharacterized membrane protein YeaQ/YmgE (transglycosylase-associated protein family)